MIIRSQPLYAIVLLASMSGVANAQSITIAGPTNSDGFFHPGDTMNVYVTAPQNCFVTVSAPLHYQTSPPFSTTTPHNFTVTIPSNAAAGVQTLKARFNCAPTQSQVGLTIGQFEVEPGQIASNATLSVSPASVWLKFNGQAFSVNVYLNENNSSMQVSRSSLLTATVADPSIVSVDGATVASGSHDGTTYVEFSLGELSVSLPVTNEATGLRGDLNGDSKVDIDDLNILDGALNTPANGPSDARDLNHDGIINALDARILVTLCTRPGCATH